MSHKSQDLRDTIFVNASLIIWFYCLVLSFNFMGQLILRKLNQLPFMDRNSREWHLILLGNYYNQLHLTVIDESDFIRRLGGYERLITFRDAILDKINDERRILGII